MPCYFNLPDFPLVQVSLPLPIPLTGQVLVKVIACGVWRTDLHIIDRELNRPKLPLILGHEIIGMVVKTGELVDILKNGDLVGIPWIGTHVVNASIVSVVAKTFAIGLYLPDILWMGGLLSIQ
jgi:D-arabinose 1-dehydrogenase-like Zn-dependent alcohol dehydrogenase